MRADLDDYREAKYDFRWTYAYLNAVAVMEVSPDESRESVLGRLEALVNEIVVNDAELAPARVRQLLMSIEDPGT
jgi:hypothetical protein